MKPVLVVDDDEWDDYCSFAERVIDLTDMEVETRDDYTIRRNADGTATITGLDVGHDYKILYSTNLTWSERYLTSLKEETYTFDNVDPGDSVTFSYTTSHQYSADPLGVIHGYDVNVMMEITVKSSHAFVETTSDPSLDGVHYNFKVFKGETFDNNYYFWDNVTYEGVNVTVTCVSQEPTILHTYITSPIETVHIDYLDIRLYLGATISYNITTKQLNVTFSPEMLYVYEEHMGGRYEWVVAGRDAHTVDSIGAALAAAAIKNKGIEIGYAGMDIIYTEYDIHSVPNIMRKFGVDNTWDDFLDDGSTPGERAALRDDWCTNWPVSSSNIIGVGGPLINLFTYYMNDFVEGFYGIPDFTPYGPWSGAVIGLTCWSKNAYYSNETYGYAVIGTYKDLNGTIGIVIWGVWGRDTFYATKWFHENIHYLQTINDHVTAIILRIDYTDPEHPTFTIVEHLGTISEKEPIHEDP